MRILKQNSKLNCFRKAVIYLLTYCILFNTSVMFATPSGGTFVDGTGSINTVGTATNVVVDQVQSVIEWDSIDTLGGAPGVRESLNFAQGSLTDSAVLNRVSGPATQFNGDLNAAGMRIFIVNPSGVIFGEGATINVNQLVASGLAMSNSDFSNAINNPTEKMVFDGSNGDVTNNGTITATNSVYLVGEDVTNNGTILCPDGLVVMAAGDTLRLGQPGSSIIVDISTDLITDFGNDLSNNGSVGESGASVGKLVLAAGDVFSQAITNVEDFAVIAYEDVVLNGDIDVTGAVDVLGGQNPSYGEDIEIHGNITAASIRIKNGVDTGTGSVGEKSISPITIDEGKNITATDGDVIIEAVHDLIIGGNVEATGDVHLNADQDGYGNPTEPGYSEYAFGGGDLVANGTITAGGNVDIYGNAVKIEGDVTATNGDLTITGRTSPDSADSTLINDGEWGQIQVAEGVTLSAGQDVHIIDGGGGPEDSTPPGMMTLLGDESLTIVAGTAEGVDDGQIIVENTSMGVVGATSLNLEQDLDLDLSQEQWNLFNQDETDLTLTSNNGSVTAVETGDSPENAADQWASVDATAYTDITLTGDSGDITTKTVISETGNIEVSAKGGKLIAEETIEAKAGSLELTGSDGIEAAGDLLAGQDVTINSDLMLNGGEWILNDGFLNWENGDQSITASAGTVTAKSWIWKETPGQLNISGGSPELAVDLQGGYMEDAGVDNLAVATAGDLYIHGNGDVQIGGYVTALGGYYWGLPELPETEEQAIEPIMIGGVSIVSDNGKIYTQDGVNNDTLNVIIEGASSQADNIGVGLPLDPDKKAAIVIKSKENLNLGEDAELFADGSYDPEIVDDRDAVGLLDVPTTIGNNPRDEGEPIDVAVYLASTGTGDGQGNINLEVGSVEINGQGTMVVDAYRTVSFGDLGSAESESFNISRLEVVSRITEWLEQAIGRLPLAGDSAAIAGFENLIGGDYVLRGAGLENTTITDGRAWVLESHGLPAAPLPQLVDVDVSGCPALLEWTVQEIGIDAALAQIWITNTLASAKDIQPCDACANLSEAAKVLQDADGSRIAALAQVINEFASSDAPPSEEQMASVANAIADNTDEDSQYALAGEYLDSLVAYVGILQDLGLTAEDAIGVATDKYIAPLAEDNVGLATYMSARLTSGQ